ncbi:MAG: hypothetical protein RLZ42_1184 [Armatimonadota bacterium]
MSISELRQKIDAIDNQILSLLSDRAKLAQEIGLGKTRTAGQFFAPDREVQIFERLLANNLGPFSGDAVKAIFREIISASRALEASMRIAYLGPEGTFSHRAARDKFGNSAEFIPVQTISDVFAKVERGDAEYGVVPVENSTEGIVPLTLDLFAQGKARICAEVYVQVSHYLATKSDDITSVKRLYAHPQASAQCRNWLRDNLQRIEIIETTSNARSAQLAADDLESACITTDIAAEIHGLTVVASHIEDSAHNRTRFLVIGENQPQPSGRDKTSIYFSVQHRAGALMRAMAALDAHDINLTLIESRPTKQLPWEYVFFLDFNGHIKEDRVRKALKHLEEQSMFVTVLGSYPEAH